MSRKRKNSFYLDFYGSSELLRKIESAGGNVEQAVSKAVARSMEAPKRDMQAFISSHHLTGMTEDAFGETPFEWKNGVLNYAVGYDMKKGGIAALFLDVGTPTMSPSFFINHAVEKNIDKIRDAQQAALREIFKELI